MTPAIALNPIPESEITLAKLEEAALLLSEVKTIQDAKQIHDLAKAATVYAKQHRLGEHVKQKAQAVAYVALRRIGQLLAETDRAPGGKPYQKRATRPDVEPVPTLADLGLDRKTSSCAQRLWKLPADRFEDLLIGSPRLDKILAEQRLGERMIAELIRTDFRMQNFDPGTFEFRACPCAELFASGVAPDLVIAEPPSEPQSLPVFSEIASGCRQAGVPLLAVKATYHHLPDVLQRLCEHLTYVGMLAELRESSPRNLLREHWSPVIICKSQSQLQQPYFDRTAPRDVETWAAWIITRFTKPGDLVCDPFLRPGIPKSEHRQHAIERHKTTAFAALAAGRRFVGSHPDADLVEAMRWSIGRSVK